MVKKNIISVIEHEAFVPLNEFELEECRKLVGLRVASVKNFEFAQEFHFMTVDLLEKSSRFCGCSTVSKRNMKVTGEPNFYYEGYEDVDKLLYYIRCNNGMILFFNDKCELVGRT